MVVTPDLFREAMRLWATGVTIVTANHNSIYHGMTVSSFTSIALEPPLVMVSLQHGTKTRELVLASDHFGVSILGEGQQEISDRFAGRIMGIDDRFMGLSTFTMVTGSPILKDSLAGFDCHIVHCYEAGTHTIILGEVLAVHLIEHSENNLLPLVYFNRSYHTL